MHYLKGFTLIELLIVLIILGGLTALIFPRMQNLLESIEMSLQEKDVLNQIAGLGYVAYQKAQPIVFEGNSNQDSAKFIQLPPFWTISTEQPVRYSEMGVCNGGTITLNYKRQQQKLFLAPPYCQPEKVTNVNQPTS
jgi:prepilin-type N-terminal cleavage/methylation domain-containing protein